MKRWLETGTAAASACPIARSHPVMPPIFMTSGMQRSHAPAARARAMSWPNHQFSPVWIGTGDFSRTRAWPARSSAGTGSSTHARSKAVRAWMRRRASGAVSDWLKSTISFTSVPMTRRTPVRFFTSQARSPTPILTLMARNPCSTLPSSDAASATGSTTP